jgi:protein ImuA
MSTLPAHVESIHHALWRGTQLARGVGKTVDTGYAALSAEMPGGGWPIGVLVELLVQQPGVGALAFSYLGLPAEKLMRVRAPKTADALWSAEQILRAGSCGALLFWQHHIRTDALRRLHLAAQATETLFVLVRPLASAADASPAALRLGLRPAEGGLVVDILKRKGPSRNETLSVALQPSPILLSPYGRVRRHSITPAIAGGVPSEVVA